MDFTDRVYDEGDKGDIMLLADCLALLFFHMLSNVSNLILETRWDNSFVFFHLVINEQFSRLTTFKRASNSNAKAIELC